MGQDSSKPEPPVPSSSFKLEDGFKCVECQIDREQFSEEYSNSISYIDERVIIGVVENVIYRLDLQTKEIREFLPFNIDSRIQVCGYIYLDNDCGLILYYFKKNINLSFISFNFTKNTYKFVGRSHVILNRGARNKELMVKDYTYQSSGLVFVATSNDILYLFELDCHAWRIKRQKQVKIPSNISCPQLIYNQIYVVCFELDIKYPESETDNPKMHYSIGGVSLLNDNGTIDEVENNKVCLKTNFFEQPLLVTGKLIGQFCWENNQFYVMFNFCDNRDYALTKPCFATFDVDTQKWTEINMSFQSFNRGFEKFVINKNLMICLNHFETIEENEDDEEDDSVKVNFITHKFRLSKAPEKLYHLALFCVRECGFIKKNKLLKQIV
ncbi:hypothetical protein M3Y97_00722600 [Aphelenchoides bicaudatus]|nr:hypothetical protein M3Y97_00722600 [Aphelenchoides bicaudatus]